MTTSAAPTRSASPLRRLTRFARRCLGWALFALGAVGLVVPLLPTTIFWILALAVLGGADPRLARRIRGWPGVGPRIGAFLDHGALDRAGKAAALLGLALAAVVVAWATSDGWARVAVWGTLAAVALFVATRPSPPQALAPPPPDEAVR